MRRKTVCAIVPLYANELTPPAPVAPMLGMYGAAASWEGAVKDAEISIERKWWLTMRNWALGAARC